MSEQILKQARENPEHILCLFTKDNFKVAKEFWGEEKMDRVSLVDGKERIFKLDNIWKHRLQQIVLLSPHERVIYLEQCLTPPTYIKKKYVEN